MMQKDSTRDTFKRRIEESSNRSAAKKNELALTGEGMIKNEVKKKKAEAKTPNSRNLRRDVGEKSPVGSGDGVPERLTYGESQIFSGRRKRGRNLEPLSNALGLISKFLHVRFYQPIRFRLPACQISTRNQQSWTSDLVALSSPEMRTGNPRADGKDRDQCVGLEATTGMMAEIHQTATTRAPPTAVPES
jgi:hypothetical protein